MSLDRALARAGTHTQEDIDAGVANGRFQRWDGDASTIITEIVQYPLYRMLRFFLAEGNLTEIEAMVPGIMFWAVRHGCTKAELIGREGWQRSFAVSKLGAKPTAVVLEVGL